MKSMILFELLVVFLCCYAGIGLTRVPPVNRGVFWIEPTLIALKDPAQFGIFFELHYNLNGTVDVPTRSGSGLAVTYEFTLTSQTFPKFPNLDQYLGLRLKTTDTNLIKSILKGDAAVASYYQDGSLKESTRIQIQGVLDYLYTYTGALGVVISGSTISLRLWSPIAFSVNARIFENATPSSPSRTVALSLDSNTGVWSASSTTSDWLNKYYVYDVTLYAPSLSSVITNTVTDPYSVSLAVDSSRSQIIDLYNDATWKPTGWDTLQKPTLSSFLDIVVYELHVRDFSVFDETVPEAERGTYNAFEYNGLSGRALSAGMNHLSNLGAAGLSHLHLLPTNDIGSVPEDRNNREDPDPDYLATFPGYSYEQQEIVGESRFVDSYNWGYDPYHFGVPDGSYAVAAEQSGGARVKRYRTMIQRLSEIGLRVVEDVVYNHVFEYGQASRSVLDKVVPGYYLRMDNNGVIQQQSCCPDMATEFSMVEKLMIDNLVLWAKAYKIDAFRFDLMGFHTLTNMDNIRSALDLLRPEVDGVNGRDIYIYGEGWDFGSAKTKGLSIASQFGVAGRGIGTFNDRIRDSLHGGSNEDSLVIRTQGFINGLSYDWNGYYYNNRYQGDLRYRTDVIRVGISGNLQNFVFTDQNGQSQTGIGFNGVGYTLSPQECINYVASHDDQSLFDLCVFKAPSSTTRDDRSRIQNLALSVVALSQGIPFFDAGVDMLRSKSLDRNTYDSGDWYNGLDFQYEKNNFAIGMPPEWGNEARYGIIEPYLRDTSIAPTRTEILKSVEHLKEFIRIRKSSKLFRLTTETDIKNRLKFYNTGPSQTDALIVFVLLDDGSNGLPQIDPTYRKILVVVNADKLEKRYTVSELIGNNLVLHPVLQTSYDLTVRSSSFNSNNGEIYIPKKTTAVFVWSR